jgi:predicted O-methyltransferase YrrM
MNTEGFLSAFQKTFSEGQRSQPTSRLSRFLPFQKFRDPCPDVVGMASPKKLKLLNLAVSFLTKDDGECYLEVGTFQGKSLIAALLGNKGRAAIACDNFSEFDSEEDSSNITILNQNLSRYGMSDSVRLYNEDFLSLLSRWKIENLPSVGVYFYDGAHDEASQYEAIRSVEDLLSDRALVIVDDWREESGSFAEAGTRRAISQSRHSWSIQWVLPARYNGDLAMWWNGVAILVFKR